MAFQEKGAHGVGNGTTAVDVVPAPASAHTFVVRNVVVANKDTAAITVTLNLFDSAGPSTRRLVKQTLAVDQTLLFESLVVLDATTKKIQMVMSGAPATTQPDFNAAYGDVS